MCHYNSRGRFKLSVGLRATRSLSLSFARSHTYKQNNFNPIKRFYVNFTMRRPSINRVEPRPGKSSAHPLSLALDKRPLNSSAMQFLVESNNLGYNVGILRVRMRVRVRMALGGDWRHLHFRISLPSALPLHFGGICRCRLDGGGATVGLVDANRCYIRFRPCRC